MKKIFIILFLFLLITACKKEQQSFAYRRVTWRDIYNKSVDSAKGWKFIVIHHSATNSGSAASFHSYHTKKGYGGLAYHFIIGNGRGAGNGEIQAGFRWKEQIAGTHVTVDAWYHNVFGIGICLVGNFQKYRPTKNQLKSLIRLIKKLCKKYNIPKKNIMGHGGVPHGKILIHGNKLLFKPDGTHEERVCPGRYFPMKYVKKMAFR